MKINSFIQNKNVIWQKILLILGNICDCKQNATYAGATGLRSLEGTEGKDDVFVTLSS